MNFLGACTSTKLLWIFDIFLWATQWLFRISNEITLSYLRVKLWTVTNVTLLRPERIVWQFSSSTFLSFEYCFSRWPMNYALEFVIFWFYSTHFLKLQAVAECFIYMRINQMLSSQISCEKMFNAGQMNFFMF